MGSAPDPLRRGQDGSHRAPEVPSDGRHHITEGRFLFGIPGSLLEGERLRVQGMSPQHRQAEQTQQTRRRPLDGFLRPLSLGLEPEMSPYLLEGDFNVWCEIEMLGSGR